jgi:glutamine amidotransferase-like uncharacterized protein
MKPRAGLFGESRQFFDRFIEECGVFCEIVTPQMVATPFYRGRFSALIIPTGFAHPGYSKLLPALRASSSRLRRFVENGGNLLVFGAGIDRPDAYDWLPFTVRYQHQYASCSLDLTRDSVHTSLVADYDVSCIPCDGVFPVYDGKAIATAHGCAVMVEREIGKGTILVTTVHEYPSRAFVTSFCTAGCETLF